MVGTSLRPRAQTLEHDETGRGSVLTELSSFDMPYDDDADTIVFVPRVLDLVACSRRNSTSCRGRDRSILGEHTAIEAKCRPLVSVWHLMPLRALTGRDGGLEASDAIECP